MYDNRLRADQIAALEVEDAVTMETSLASFGRSLLQTGKVVRLTPKQVVVHYASNGRTVETRFRRDDGRKVGDGHGYLLDPAHPLTVERLAQDARARRRSEIDALASRWSRERENLDLLRRLHTAVGEYLDAEA